MKINTNEGDDDHLAIYAELQPIPRHRSLIDHLFVLRDRGRLRTRPQPVCFAVFRDRGDRAYPDQMAGQRMAAWKAFHLPPRFGRKPRQRSFHGWMLGIRYRPLDLPAGDPVFASLSERFDATFQAGESEDPFDPIIGALDLDRGYPSAACAAGSPHLRVLIADTALSEWNRDRAAPCCPRGASRCRSPHAAAPFSQAHRACAQAICGGSALQRRAERRLRLEAEVWRISRRKPAIAIKRI